jgi:hypothetical protein
MSGQEPDPGPTSQRLVATAVRALLGEVRDETRDDLRRADATAGVYVIGLAGIAALIGQIATSLNSVVRLICAVAGIPALLAVWCCLRVFKSRIGNQDQAVTDDQDQPDTHDQDQPGADNHGQPRIGSWVHADAVRDPELLLAAYEATDPGRVVAGQLPLLGSIASRKFQWLKPAGTLMEITVVALGLALLVGIALAVAALL